MHLSSGNLHLVTFVNVDKIFCFEMVNEQHKKTGIRTEIGTLQNITIFI